VTPGAPRRRARRGCLLLRSRRADLRCRWGARALRQLAHPAPGVPPPGGRQLIRTWGPWPDRILNE
jgi:hypothetical protein